MAERVGFAQATGNDEAVSGSEIARRLGVSRQRVHQWAAQASLHFPAPVASKRRGVLWRWVEVQKWAEERETLRNRA